MEKNPYEDTQSLEPARMVQLIDERGDSMLVQVVVEVEINDNLYALLTPANPVIDILKADKSDEDAPFEQVEPKEFSSIAKNIQDALARYQLKLEIQADEFVLMGEADESFYEDSEVISLESDDEDKEYIVLIEVDDAVFQYLVVEPMNPVIYPGEILSDEQARLLSDNEMNGLESIFSEILVDGLGESEDEF
jgi:uncharacterized protein YrzB (UPF0473 family)